MGPVKAFGQHSLERAVRAAGITVPAVWADVTASTNDIARKLAEEGAPEWTVVAAGHQTAGRGRLGRSWHDAPGSSLLFSVVLRPDVRPEEAPLLSLLAATKLIASLDHPRLGSKWPNDLVVGERKVGGVLAEAKVASEGLRHVVLGVGINVAMEPEDFPEEMRDRATSLVSEGINPPEDAMEAILRSFLAGFRVPHRPDEIVARYRRICTTLGRPVRARTTDGSEIEGRAIDVDAQGGLVVETSAGVRVVSFGEVSHVDARDSGPATRRRLLDREGSADEPPG